MCCSFIDWKGLRHLLDFLLELLRVEILCLCLPYWFKLIFHLHKYTHVRFIWVMLHYSLIQRQAISHSYRFFLISYFGFIFMNLSILLNGTFLNWFIEIYFPLFCFLLTFFINSLLKFLNLLNLLMGFLNMTFKLFAFNR